MDEKWSRIEILRQATYHMVHIGFQARQRGYRYLREAIWIVYHDPTALRSVTKILYPEIARLFSTTDKQVERAIRNAIETAWTKGSQETIREIFGEAFIGEKARPTNTEFIIKLIRYMTGM